MSSYEQIQKAADETFTFICESQNNWVIWTTTDNKKYNKLRALLKRYTKEQGRPPRLCLSPEQIKIIDGKGNGWLWQPYYDSARKAYMVNTSNLMIESTKWRGITEPIFTPLQETMLEMFYSGCDSENQADWDWFIIPLGEAKDMTKPEIEERLLGI